MKQLRIWAEISLTNLLKNYKTAENLVGDATIMPIIKADAYGHGAVRVAKTLQAKIYGVATPEEALELREAGITADILLLAPAPKGWIRELCEQNIILCVTDSDCAKRYKEEYSGHIRTHAKIDTGMGRLGVRNLPENIEAVFTHFAKADDVNGLDYTRYQLAEFKKVVEDNCRPQVCPPQGVCPPQVYCPPQVHFANSAAICAGIVGGDFVRPGIMLYGYSPFDGVELSPVLSLKSRVIQCKDINEGVGVSYAHSWKATQNSRIAVISAGYADGVPRCLSNKMSVVIGGRKYPQIGNICMDMFMIDITGSTNINPGDEAVLIGGDITAATWADMSGTIPYEILCGIGKRVTRVHM